jgi:two-component system, NtrC family, sensor histidine kinase HydH
MQRVPGRSGSNPAFDDAKSEARRRTVSYWPLSTYNAGMAASFFEEMKSRIGFGEQDVAHLGSLTPVITPLLTVVTDSFYRWLFEDLQARALFTGGQEQMDRQRQLFTQWIKELLSGPYDEAYYQKHLIIGHTHVRVGLPQRYMFTAFEIVWQELKRVILEKKVSDQEAKLAALHKLFTLEIAIMLESYKESYSTQIRHEERLVVEERLTQSEHMAKIGQLAASLAHEIKNPLAGISGAIQVIRDGMDKSDPRRDVIREILSQIDRLDNAVKDLLVYARPKPPELKPCNLAGVVQTVLNLNRTVPLLRSLHLTLDEQGDLPLVQADSAQIEQLVINLLFNAAQASEPGDHISIVLLPRQGYVRLIVTDEGHGMDQVTCERSFEPFFTTKAKGTGLGLPICKKIVEAHGGIMRMESKLDRGTTVIADFPIDGRASATKE